MTRRRRLRPDEVDLWQQVARSAQPLSNNQAPRDPMMSLDKPEAATSGATKPPAPLSPFAMGEAARSTMQTHAFPRNTADRLQSAPVQMDAKAFKKMQRGALNPEARVDLHGMTQDRAHGALTHFILSAQSRGLRLVLVITGKGAIEDPYDPAPRRRGVLKTQVPQWLRLPPLASAVLQVSEAHRKHGGAGAYYVYLRRAR